MATIIAPSPARAVAATFATIVFAAAALIGRRPSRSMQLRVNPEANVLIRNEDGSEERALRALFVAPWLIVLGDARTTLPVWPDRLGTAEYRRLAVACRWHPQSAT
jgi:hypothetical protein